MAERKDSENLISKAVGIVSDVETAVNPNKNGIAQKIGGVSGMLTKLMDSMLSVISPFVKVQSSAVDLAKAVGLAGKSIMSNSTMLIEQNKKMQLSAQYGISNEQMMALTKGVMMGLQRNVQIDQAGVATPENPNFDSSFENLIAASQVFGPDRVTDIVAGYDKLGISMKNAAKATGKLYAEAGKYGINLTKYAENFSSNLQMAQMYNFRNGVNGLKEMARKATEIRQDMKQIAAFADKVGSVTGAVETAANLQVLGGSFAALSNPLTMLNKSLTDINGLQDMAISMTEGAATYNSFTHEIEMDPVTRQIMKRAAESMGMNPENLIDQAYAQARQAEIKNQMEGLGVSDNLQNLLKNAGEIDSETGAAGATIDGKFRTLAEIAADPELQQQLIEETQSESEDIKVIAKSVMGIEQIVAGKKGQIENEVAGNVIKPGMVGGKSSYDLAMEMATKRLDENVMAGAAALDQTARDIYQTFLAFTGSIMTEAVKPFSSTSPEEFATKMGEGFANVFGEDARGFGESLGGGVANFAETLDAKLQEYGFSPMAPFHGTPQAGAEGRTEPIEKPQGTEGAATSSVALAARDVTLQASNFSVAGTQNVHFEPLAAIGELNRATAAATNEPDFEALLTDALTSIIGYSVTIPVEPTTNGNNGGNVVIKGTEQSIPGAQVTVPVGNNMQANLTEQRTETRQNGAGETNAITVSGTLTMNVNGDNGKIGTVDLIKMLENNTTFRQELAKALAETYAKMKKSGLPSN